MTRAVHGVYVLVAAFLTATGTLFVLSFDQSATYDIGECSIELTYVNNLFEDDSVRKTKYCPDHTTPMEAP